MKTEKRPVKKVRSNGYSYDFNKDTGFFARWGDTFDDDPTYSPFGPEILDIEISTICDGGCSFCVPPDTKVLTPDGEKSIQEIKVGESVYGAKIHKNGKVSRTQQIVDQTFVREYEGELIKIVTDNETLRLTPNHKLYTSKGWIRADELTEDDEIIGF